MGTEKFILKRDEVVLLVIDIQEKLAVVMSQREKVVNNTLHLIEAAKLMKIPIVVTEQYPKGLGATVPEITAAVPGSAAIEKITFDCCGQAGFPEAIAALEKPKVIVVGMETHVCVLQTCLSLLSKNCTVHVVEDAVCSRTKENFRTAINLLRQAGAVITCTETVLFQLLEKAGTDEFKTIVKRIK